LCDKEFGLPSSKNSQAILGKTPVKGEGIRDAKPLRSEREILMQMERLGRFHLQQACPNTAGSEPVPAMQGGLSKSTIWLRF
jgi:hypothetical protein